MYCPFLSLSLSAVPLRMTACSPQMLRYESAVRTPGGVDPQLRALRHCLQSHLAPDPDLWLPAGLVRQQLDLLERQRPVEAADAAVRPNTQLVGRSVISSLHYCCVHHYGEPANHLASPLAIRERHQLTEEQFAWTALRARASLQAWKDVQEMFTSKVLWDCGLVIMFGRSARLGRDRCKVYGI